MAKDSSAQTVDAKPTKFKVSDIVRVRGGLGPGRDLVGTVVGVAPKSIAVNGRLVVDDSTDTRETQELVSSVRIDVPHADCTLLC